MLKLSVDFGVWVRFLWAAFLGRGTDSLWD